MEAYSQTAKEARLKILELIFSAQTSHVGSCFSATDILTVLFEKIDLDKDKFILSAGWKAASLYYFLWKKGRISEEELNSYCKDGSKWIGLTEPIHPDIPFSGGSMGMGLPAAVGFALAKKIKKEKGMIYVLMSDGELQCGTTWESLLIINQFKLDNIKVLVDKNSWQAMGRTDDILSIPLDIFDGWYYDGHDYKEIQRGLESDNIFLFFNTVKGKGVSFFEDRNLWHYKAPNEEEYLRAKEELCLK